MVDRDSRSATSEMAFLILEDCEVEFRSPDTPPFGQWMDLDLESGETDKKQGENFSCEVCTLSCSFSPHDDPRIKLDLENVPIFEGTTKGLMSPCLSCGRCERSDASLLLGLLLFCDSIVSIEKFRLFRKKNNRFAMVITISFPNVMKGEPGHRSILSKFAKSNERLCPALQTILSILRSDWEYLAVFMDWMKRTSESKQAPTKSNHRRFFPSNFTLEEMYSRVNGSPTMQRLARRDMLDNRQQNADCFICQLSPEILADKIAPYLRAPSLNALRSTCSCMHAALRSVVPGLRLHLYNHQIKSLTWMRSREAAQLNETDLFEMASTDPHAIDGDAHRAATGGLTALLVMKGSPSGAIRINQLTGNEIRPRDHLLERDIARGGLLCDDPGLGKTITVLSLILQTAGKMPALGIDSQQQIGDVDQDHIFQTYWSEEYVVPHLRLQALLRLLNTFMRSERIENQFPLNSMRNAISEDRYEEFSKFEEDMEAHIGAFVTDEEARIRLIAAFRLRVQDFKAKLLQTARKSFSNVSAKPNSRVASLVSQHLKAKFLKSLKPSRATLLVVPAVLMDHWEEQIVQHVDLGYFTPKTPLIFRFGEGSTLSVDDAWQLVQGGETHSAVMFLDRGGARQLPSPEFLAQFQIVLTTNQRFVNEWKNGSFQQEIRKEGMSNTLEGLSTSSSTEACPLLKVYWHRMVIDEGHSMAKDKQTSAIQFASWIWSERKWCMTGTPTKQQSSNLNQVKALIRFLRHDFFTPRCEGDGFWQEALARSWKTGSMASFFRLRALLQFLMKRHTKADIEELPPPSFREAIIPMSLTEVNTYNTLVAGVQSNILITSMSGKTSGEQDSLLHKNNGRHAREALANIRRVCVGWSRVIPSLPAKSYRETIELGEAHGLDLSAIRDYLDRAENELLSDCAICSIRLSTLLLMPCCGGLICTECMDNKSSQCLKCGEVFDVDGFQRFQPGFVLTWKSNLVPKKRSANQALADSRRATGRPAAAGGPGGDELNDEIRRNVVQPVRRRRKFGDGHLCQYKDQYESFREDHRCILCWEEHGSCNLMNDRRRCGTCGRRAEDCPEEESKSFYLAKRLEGLHSLHGSRQSDRSLKVIVFSQFRKALNIVGSRLLNRFGPGCVAEYWGKYRRQELHKFSHQTDCFCLLLTRDGSEGLDLSFVTHIFFLEEIWDKALEKQAVARAWRMGAKGRVEVETLIAQNSVEETMRHSDTVAGEPASPKTRVPNKLISQAEQQQSKTKALLLSLRFITDYHTFSKATGDEAIVPNQPSKKRSLPNFEWTSQVVERTEPQAKRSRQVSFQLPNEVETEQVAT